MKHKCRIKGCFSYKLPTHVLVTSASAGQALNVHALMFDAVVHRTLAMITALATAQEKVSVSLLGHEGKKLQLASPSYVHCVTIGLLHIP